MRPSVLGLIFERDNSNKQSFYILLANISAVQAKSFLFLWLVSKVNSESKKGLYA